MLSRGCLLAISRPPNKVVETRRTHHVGVVVATVSEQLVGALSPRKLADLPEALIHESKRLLLDFLGVGLAGSRSESGRAAAAFAEEATLLGRPERADVLHAAFVNAIASHSVELDDIDEDAYFHYAPPVLAPSLAAAELVGSSGACLLLAIVAGCETMIRLSMATNPDLRDRGFHTTPACGVFGAAMSTGLLLGLSNDQLVSSLGLAGAQASGLLEVYGPSMQKRFNPGPAARSGLTAALMARVGFTGADTIIEGKRGFAAAFAGSFDRDRFLAGLGETIPVTIEYKPYSCARPIHNAIDAMLILRERGLTPSQVEEIVVRRHPAWASYHGVTHPRSFHEAQMSLPYSVALALVLGKALPEQYSLVGRGDDEVMNISAKVVIEPAPELSRGVSCELVVRTRVGETLRAVVDHPLGSVQRPLSDEQMVEKFLSLAVESVGDRQANELVDRVWDIDTSPNISALVSLLAPADRREQVAAPR